MSGWLPWDWRPKGTTLAVAILCWVFYLHGAGVYLFTRGFLLTRMSLADISSCPDSSCTLQPTHERVVLLIIDALRFDFVSPDPPTPPSPFHHNVLTLPQELTRKDPSRSFLFNAYSDPPTTTMQRIKGITTGSLPTFVDMSANFGATSIDEDSIINQLNRAGKRCAFMGDDTWMSVFPTLFSPNMTYPYDSFDVEDLHTVDEGVIRHLFPLLEGNPRSWDAIVGHFLGVDHVGHRVGPDHPVMREKLLQMDRVLRRVVELLDEDTLLVVLGDHGMDRKGDHGGDDVFETSSAMWIYSKGPELRSKGFGTSVPAPLTPNVTYPKSLVSHRAVQQIDLVPTISLLLGLPIPFNNLGTMIPELFYRYVGQGWGKRSFVLDDAMKINVDQIKRYLEAYHKGSAGHELDAVWGSLQASWATTRMPGDPSSLDLASRYFFTRYVLETCRSLWAQFNVALISVGLVVLGVGLFTVCTLYVRLRTVTDWEKWAGKRVGNVAMHMLAGSVVGLLASWPLRKADVGIGALDLVLGSSSLASCIALILDSSFTVDVSLADWPMPHLGLVLHALSFFSNSFTFWEDRILSFLLISSLIPSIHTALSSPDRRLGYRILMFAMIFALCIRLMAISTICREEQQPYCHVTFYASSSVASPPPIILLLVLPIAFLLPTIMKRALSISASDKGLVPAFLSYILRPALLAGSACWILEWVESSELLGEEWSSALRTSRTVIARCTLGGLIIVAPSLWWLNCLCVEIQVQKSEEAYKDPPQVTVVLNSNMRGASYLLFWSMALAVVYLATQLTGQVVLALATIALLCHLEICDSVRDIESINTTFSTSDSISTLLGDSLSSGSGKERRVQPPLSFSQCSVLVLLSLHSFHGTGHQATLSSLQWKAAFLLTPRLSYPSSPILIALNTFGPHVLLSSMAAPLLACWQLSSLTSSPSAKSITKPGGEALRASVRACIAVMLYFGVLTLSSAIGAAWLRRHLMVWKVFAPRYMAAAVGLLIVDAFAIFAVGMGVHRAEEKVSGLFRNMEQGRRRSKEE